MAENKDINETRVENIKATILPEIGETVLDISRVKTSQQIGLSIGQKINDGYIVIRQLGNEGSQAFIYLAKKNNQSFIIKLYQYEYQPKISLIQSLMKQESPYIAKLLAYGYIDGKYYEIYENYEQGNLDEKNYPLSFIQEILIPNINEGLHYLHYNLGIVHGDIKPGNIFIADGESKAVIGDFGICSYTDQNGKLIDDIKGTPEYSLPTISFYGKTTKSFAYDYGSFGLTLIKAITGHSLFEGYSIDEIAKECEEGIYVPDEIEGRLRRLVQGLLISDENSRYKYEEVKKWCEGEYVSVSRKIRKNKINENARIQPFLFGKTDTDFIIVYDLKELSTKIIENWEYSKKHLSRVQFYEFLEQFNIYLKQETKMYIEKYGEDGALFRILYRIYDISSIIYKGVDYGDIRSFIQILTDNVSGDACEIVRKGMLEYYAVLKGYPDAVINELHLIGEMNVENDQLLAKMLFYLFHRQNGVDLGGTNINNISDLLSYVVKLDADRIEMLTYNSSLISWLYSMGFRKETINLQNIWDGDKNI